MERGPRQGSGGMNFNLKMMIIALIAVSIFSFVFYFVYQQLGEFYAWSIVFLIVVNIYMIYRTTIRKNIGEKLFKKEELYQPESKQMAPSIGNTSNGGMVTSSQEILNETHSKCPNCDGKLIEGMDYCEECGEEI